MIRFVLFFICFSSSLISESQTLIPKELVGHWVLEKAVLEESPLNKASKISQVVLLPKQSNAHFMFRSCILELNWNALDSTENMSESSTMMIYPEVVMKDPKVSIIGNTISFREFSPDSKLEEDPSDTPLTYTYRFESENSLILSTREAFYNNPSQTPIKGQLHIYLIRK